MTALELIDQMLGRPTFNCTEKQMRFLRELFVQGIDPVALERSNQVHLKTVRTALRREATNARKDYEKAQKNLEDFEKENKIDGQ